jgi:hypothetical protein
MDDTVRFAAREQSSGKFAFESSVATDGLPADLASRAGVAVVVTNKAIQV